MPFTVLAEFKKSNAATNITQFTHTSPWVRTQRSNDLDQSFQLLLPCQDQLRQPPNCHRIAAIGFLRRRLELRRYLYHFSLQFTAVASSRLQDTYRALGSRGTHRTKITRAPFHAVGGPPTHTYLRVRNASMNVSGSSQHTLVTRSPFQPAAPCYLATL